MFNNYSTTMVSPVCCTELQSFVHFLAASWRQIARYMNIRTLARAIEMMHEIKSLHTEKAEVNVWHQRNPKPNC